jgi:ABC-2 type transport system permease protein
MTDVTAQYTTVSPAAVARADRLAELPLELTGPPRGFVTGTARSVRDVWSYRELLSLLVRRELKARYKDSILGFLWSLMRPLALLAVYYIAVGKFLNAGGDDYAIYVFGGITVWGLFSEIVGAGTGSILANGGLVKKIYLPREVFPLSVVGSALFNFIIQLIILVSATFVVGRPPWGERLGFGVLAMLIVLIWGTAFALLLSAINVYLRDVQYLVEIALLWGMWSAPIVYQWPQVSVHLGHGFLEKLFLCNPITEAVLGFHKAFWVSGDKPTQVAVGHGASAHLVSASNYPDHMGRYMVGLILVGLVLLWAFQRVFARLQDNFAQEL